MQLPKLFCLVILCFSGAVWAVDTDGDGVDDAVDNCQSVVNAAQVDTDGDGYGDACDHYLNDVNEHADTDQDGLPDNWEAEHGRNPQRPDYQIVADGYDYSSGTPIHDRCSIVEGVAECQWAIGGGIPGSNPFAAGLSPVNAYGMSLSKGNVVLYRGDAANSYTNSWSINSAPAVASDVTSVFSIRALPTSFTTSTTRIGISCWHQNPHYLTSKNANDTFTCAVSGEKQMTCTLTKNSTPGQLCTASPDLTTTTYTTKGTIAYLTGKLMVGCALTEYGPECFGGSISFSGNFDPDGDGVSGLGDVFPLDLTQAGDADADGVDGFVDNCTLNSNSDQLNTDGDAQGNACDTDDDNDGVIDIYDAFPLSTSEFADADHDGIGNNADWDDDNDGVPDTVDAAPRNAANATEITLPLDGSYKGLRLKGVRNATP